MKRNEWIAALFVFGFVGLLSVQALAEEKAADAAAPAASSAPAVAPADAVAPEAGQPAGQEEEPEYAFGTAKSVDGDKLVINEFDYDTGEEKEASYWVDSKTEYDNVASLKEVVAGD